MRGRSRRRGRGELEILVTATIRHSPPIAVKGRRPPSPLRHGRDPTLADPVGRSTSDVLRLSSSSGRRSPAHRRWPSAAPRGPRRGGHRPRDRRADERRSPRGGEHQSTMRGPPQCRWLVAAAVSLEIAEPTSGARLEAESASRPCEASGAAGRSGASTASLDRRTLRRQRRGRQRRQAPAGVSFRSSPKRRRHHAAGFSEGSPLHLGRSALAGARSSEIRHTGSLTTVPADAVTQLSHSVQSPDASPTSASHRRIIDPTKAPERRPSARETLPPTTARLTLLPTSAEAVHTVAKVSCAPRRSRGSRGLASTKRRCTGLCREFGRGRESLRRQESPRDSRHARLGGRRRGLAA